MYQGKMIDAHMHLWDLKNNYPWLKIPVPDFEKIIGDYKNLRRNFLPNDYLKLIGNAPIVKTVHVQAFGFPEDPVAETRWLSKLADEENMPHGIVGFANLADPAVEDILKHHVQFKRVKGIRMPLNFHKTPYRCMADRGDYLSDPIWQNGFALLEKYNLSFDVQIYDHQLSEVLTLAEKFPNIVLIIEHFAWPTDLSANGFEIWRDRIEKITAFPNIFMKLSGIGCVFQKMEKEKIIDYIKEALNVLGVDKCLFGSNCPPDTLFYNTFSDLLAVYNDALTDFSPEDQFKFFYLNAEKVYRL